MGAWPIRWKEESMIVLAVEFQWGEWLRRVKEIGWMAGGGGAVGRVYARSGG